MCQHMQRTAKHLGSEQPLQHCHIETVGEYHRVVARVDRVGRMLNGLIASLQPKEEDWAE